MNEAVSVPLEKSSRRKTLVIAAVFILLSLFGISIAITTSQRNLPMQQSNVLPESTRPAFPSPTVTPIAHATEPIGSNQWYSSVYFSFPTEPIFAYPISYKISSRGLSFSYPTVSPSQKTVFGTYSEDLTVGLPTGLGKPEVVAVGDWHIALRMTSQNDDQLSFFLAHGLPYTSLRLQGDLKLQIPSSYKIFNNNGVLPHTGNTLQSNAFVISVKNRNYIVVLDKKTNLSVNASTITGSGVNRVFIGLLDTRSHYNDFKSLAGIDVLGTMAVPTENNDKITTTYSLITNKANPLITLFPHQQEFLTTNMNRLGSYDTLRGRLTLIKANTFTTAIPKTVPPDTFPALTVVPDDLTAQIREDIDSVIQKGPPASRDYFLGVWLGRVSNLLLLADTAGLTAERERLEAFIKPFFAESLANFRYDPEKTSLIATKPEFGNEELNDHHFQYGYFIRTGAVLAKLDPSYLQQIKPGIDAMVQDVANLDRSSKRYPYLRNFDRYEGHSWADGDAKFADGNNQESSSEAMNAWYSIYLWGKATNDDTLRTYGLYLYNTEIQSTYHYWFDTKDIYKAPYGHEIASIVWGGKVDFTTWFSQEANKIYGIQLLPFTPASMYLGKLPNFEKYDRDFHESGGSEAASWGDLFIMWKSFYDPEGMFQFRNRTSNFEEANTRSLYLYFLHYNQQRK
jgi:endoglucanase Acf2